MTTAHLVRRLFALPPVEPVERSHIPPDIVRSALPGAGEIALLTGPSGGGKSRLLAAIRHASAHDPQVAWIDPASIALHGPGEETLCVVERVCMEIGLRPDAPAPIELALELLGRVGLAEAWTYLQPPDTLSDGQRWRLLLALAIARAIRVGSANPRPTVAILAMDEFAALLDRITARIVARALRRLIDRQPAGAALRAIVVTAHDDLLIALDPEIVVTCDFGCYSVNRRAPFNACR